jgi:hypothetical protein
VLYLHGLGGRRDGPRTERLKELGFEVVYPELPADDYARSVEIAQAHLDGVDLVIGSSRGGAVAMTLKTDKPVLLLAPAWKMCGIEPTVPNQRTSIVHGLADERVPHTDSEELAGRCGIGGNLILVSDNHSLTDSVDLIPMLATEMMDGELSQPHDADPTPLGQVDGGSDSITDTAAPT